MRVNTADTGDAATKAKRSFILPQGSTVAELKVNGVVIIANDGSGVALTTQGSAYNDLLSETILDQADSAGFTLTRAKYAAPYAQIGISSNTSAMENSYTGATKGSGIAFGVSDSMTITIDGLAATVTYTQVVASGYGAGSASAIAGALVAEWNETYAGSADGTASASQVRWSLSATGGNAEGATIVATAKDQGSRDIGAAISASYSLGKTSTDSNVGFIIGNGQNFTKSAADNVAYGTYVLITLEADTAGDLLGEIGVPGDAIATGGAGQISLINTGFKELSSTFAPNSTSNASNAETATDLYPTQSRLDVIIPEEANDAEDTNAVFFTRVGWL